MIKEGDYEFHEDSWSEISNEAKDLVSGLLKVKFKDRMSPSEALMHPWIVSVSSDLKKNLIIINSFPSLPLIYSQCIPNIF